MKPPHTDRCWFDWLMLRRRYRCLFRLTYLLRKYIGKDCRQRHCSPDHIEDPDPGLVNVKVRYLRSYTTAKTMVRKNRKEAEKKQGFFAPRYFNGSVDLIQLPAVLRTVSTIPITVSIWLIWRYYYIWYGQFIMWSAYITQAPNRTMIRIRNM